MTYTYAILTVSRATFDEIRAKVEAVGDYPYAVHMGPDGKNPVIIDMHGLALQVEDTASTYLTFKDDREVRRPALMEFYAARRLGVCPTCGGPARHGTGGMLCPACGAINNP